MVAPQPLTKDTLQFATVTSSESEVKFFLLMKHYMHTLRVTVCVTIHLPGLLAVSARTDIISAEKIQLELTISYNSPESLSNAKSHALDGGFKTSLLTIEIGSLPLPAHTQS